ncbi:DUF2897 domain-containing protein [Vibrio gangliei]|uniref:DUF2897 domain-containing protein n=1 Tax=Vibrio gangliei TaxID=2077090 RepID=UPI001B80D8C4|nr:DUF2897 domain-containing protein [Vibrio gangliei]
MDLELLLNPWVISIIILVFVIGNLASMKYLGKSHLVRKNPKQKSDLDKLIEIYKEKDKEEAKQPKSNQTKAETKTSSTDNQKAD